MTKRILHIIPSLDRAGAEKQLTLLAAGLPKGEFDVHVCALTRGGPLEAELDAADIPVTVIGKRWKADPIALVRLRRFVGRLKPDLVHTWMFAANAYGRAATILAGVPHVIASERCVDRWKSAWQFAIDRRLAPRTDRIVVNTDAVRDFCIQHGLPGERITVIPNGVPPAPASDVTRAALLAELDLPDDARIIAAIGRLWPQKRVKDMIWAADLVHLLHDRMRFLVIGDGPQRRLLQQFVRDLQAGEHIRLLGHREDVARILPHVDILWQGSEYEGMPNSIMEAMAAGKPVVASDIPGNRDLVVHGETGFLAPVGSRKKFTHYTDQLLMDADLACRLGAAGQTRVRLLFPVETMIQRHVQMYRQIMLH